MFLDADGGNVGAVTIDYEHGLSEFNVTVSITARISGLVWQSCYCCESGAG